jgi:hypothetical protein
MHENKTTEKRIFAIETEKQERSLQPLKKGKNAKQASELDYCPYSP